MSNSCNLSLIWDDFANSYVCWRHFAINLCLPISRIITMHWWIHSGYWTMRQLCVICIYVLDLFGWIGTFPCYARAPCIASSALTKHLFGTESIRTSICLNTHYEILTLFHQLNRYLCLFICVHIVPFNEKNGHQPDLDYRRCLPVRT